MKNIIKSILLLAFVSVQSHTMDPDEFIQEISQETVKKHVQGILNTKNIENEYGTTYVNNLDLSIEDLEEQYGIAYIRHIQHCKDEFNKLTNEGGWSDPAGLAIRCFNPYEGNIDFRTLLNKIYLHNNNLLWHLWHRTEQHRDTTDKYLERNLAKILCNNDNLEVERRTNDDNEKIFRVTYKGKVYKDLEKLLVDIFDSYAENILPLLEQNNNLPNNQQETLSNQVEKNEIGKKELTNYCKAK